MKPKTTKSLFLLKASRNSVLTILTIAFLGILLSSFSTIRKETVHFSSSDGLSLTADDYIIGLDHPYIILLHEQGSSRGEYQTIAKKLCKMDYNCLAVDLRNGGSDHRVSNESAKLCREERCPTGPGFVEEDVLAAIAYTQQRSTHPVVLFGSSANASLSLKIATENDHVRAVVAFSPGEYFLPQISIQDTISGLKKPVFATSSQSELDYVKALVSGMDEAYLSVFEPELGEGQRGSASLSTNNTNNSEYWLALLLFFKDLL